MPGDVGPLRAQAVEGSYVLYLTDAAGNVVFDRKIGVFGQGELYLWAQIKDSSGVLAPTGAVVFEVCRAGGNGPLVFRPKVDCERGAARWSRFTTTEVDEGTCRHAPLPGNACTIWGGRPIPQTVGFRCQYMSRGSDIADGLCLPQDMAWVEVP
jgi:hypothetical protein